MTCPSGITIKLLCLMFRGNERLVMLLAGAYWCRLPESVFSRVQLGFIVAAPSVFLSVF